MLRRNILASALLGGAVLLAGSGPSVRAAEGVRAIEGVRAAEEQVMIDNFSFSPAQLTVAVGTRVTWINRDDIPHTVTEAATPRALKSPPLDTGESFAFTFDKPGAYAYFCSLHPHMQGSVIVK